MTGSHDWLYFKIMAKITLNKNDDFNITKFYLWFHQLKRDHCLILTLVCINVCVCLLRCLERKPILLMHQSQGLAWCL